MPENQVSNEQLIISLYYHNELRTAEICVAYQFSEKYVAKVLTASTIQKKDDYFIVESRLNYISRLGRSK